ncbi:MAG TPA: hypothetical protein VFV92_08710, partial [Candidatus Bathyarchaeia archaeon]|nr:hypothetical protein [Candidatus Bathyarchaeia archaeon]
ASSSREEAGSASEGEGSGGLCRRLTAERGRAVVLSEVAWAKRGPYEAEGSLHNRVLRPSEVIVGEQPASVVVKHYGRPRSRR